MDGLLAVYFASICTRNTHIPSNTVHYSVFPLLFFFFFLKFSPAIGPRLRGLDLPTLTVSVLVSLLWRSYTS